jgi:hypothetical protein
LICPLRGENQPVLAQKFRIFAVFQALNLNRRRIPMDWAKVILVIVSVAASIAASALDDDSKD